MVFCKNCGMELPTDANYCSSCGTSLKEVTKEVFTIKSDDLIKTVKKLLHEGNVRRIIIKDDKGKTLLELPVTVGVVGAIIAPWLAALGVIGALATNCTIVVVRKKK
jgi:CBS domain-containing protein